MIAVAIIAILAVAAMSNHQLASVRARVARVRADVRTIATALEAYHADNHQYPAAAVGDEQLATPLDALTAPVAYLSAVPADPFGPAPLDFNPDLTMAGFNYKDRRTTSVNMPADTYGPLWRSMPDKEYMVHSSGPNRVWDVTPYVEYDPTNGTISPGDICHFGPV